MFDVYEYNGVKFPKLPDNLTISEFPYFLWLGNNEGYFSVFCFTEKVYLAEGDILMSGAAGTYRQYLLVGDGYEQYADFNYGGSTSIFSEPFRNIIWSNWDIQRPTGEVCFFSSEPIPTTKWVTQRFAQELTMKGNDVVLNAVQGEILSRSWLIELHENGKKFIPPSDAYAVVVYTKPNGEVAQYEDDGFGSSMVLITDNVVSVIPNADMLSEAGVVKVNIKITSSGKVLYTFGFYVEVESAESVV